MSKSLIITEKPSVARDITDALGGFTAYDDKAYYESDKYVCTFAVGHLLELLEPEEIDKIYKRWTLDTLPIIPANFETKPKQGQSERLKVIKKLMQRNDVTELINACDAGREGELIFRELTKYFGNTKPIKRLWLQSMTTSAIHKGFASLQDGKKYEGLAAAAELRSISDWLIGMNASRCLTIRMRSRANKGAWSAGRVQTPTLALLVDRENEILAHIPKPYFRIAATFQATDHQYLAEWYDPNFKADEKAPELKDDRIFDRARAEAIVEKIRGKKGTASETRKPSRESAPNLFDLTSLQREANRKFSWSAARTLQSAQRCYEQHKVLTYPRTDSRCLPNDYRAEVDRILGVLSGVTPYNANASFLIKHGRQNEAKVFDDAGVSDHFAIIPTGAISAGLSGDDAKLFDLVTRRFLSAFFPPAIWEQVERTTVVLGEHFSTRARTLKEAGWRACIDQTATKDTPADKTEADAGERVQLPPLKAGTDAVSDVPIDNKLADIENDVTRPPPRITEGRLLSLMENAGKNIEDEEVAAVMHEKGLGTPATRAETIENLKSKEYIDHTLRPTVKGMRLIDLLHRVNASRITSAELTGELELHLMQVERGQRKPAEYLGEVIDYTKEIVDAVREFNYEDVYPNENPLGVCPCEKKRPVYERAWFYRCEENQAEIDAENDCPFRIWKDRSGRYIDRQTVTTLLRDGVTGELDGFRDLRGRRTYKAILAIEDKELKMKPIAGSEEAGPDAAPTFEVNPEPLGKCPVETCTNCLVVETPTHFICQTRQKMIADGEKKPTGFLMPRIVCKREIKREEAIAYMQAGETPVIADFISRYGRPFSAKLKIKPDGRHTFEFPPREGGKGRGRGKGKQAEGAEGAPAEGAEATTKKSASKKAATKKSAAKTKAKSKKSADSDDAANSAEQSAKPKVTTKKAVAKKSASKKAPAKKSAKKSESQESDE